MSTIESKNDLKTKSYTSPAPLTGYAPVNGLQMYYEVHGRGRPLVLLHGALLATGTSFGRLIPLLAETRQAISVEQQAHGRTADIDRPLTIQGMAGDTVALLKYIGIKKADFFGYSMGAGIAMQIARQHPAMVRKLVLASASYDTRGLHPGLLEGLENLQPEHLAGTPFQEEYAATAPKPEAWGKLIEKVKYLMSHLESWTSEEFQAIQAPTLLVIGDSDIVRPEHAVEMFRMLGGGVIGDNVGLPNSRLAVLPGTTHITLRHRVDWLASMIGEFLDV